MSRKRSREAKLEANSPKDSIPETKKSSRLWTPEFIAYQLIVGVALCLMAREAVNFSQGILHNNHIIKEHLNNFKYYSRYLSNGWINGRKVDNSDAQYGNFRNNIHLLLITSCLHVLFGKIVKRTAGPQGNLIYSCVFSVVYLFVMHGFNIFKILAIVSINYVITKNLSGKWIVAATWIWSLVILFANDIFKGYSFTSFLPMFGFMVFLSLIKAGMDGMQPRWWVSFNFSALRMISFSVDYYHRQNHSHEEIMSSSADAKLSEERKRVQTVLEHDKYGFLQYIAYTTYVPLYLAGPIITFHDFISQVYNPIKIPIKKVLLYALRFVFLFLLMELGLHYIHVIAITKAKAWLSFTPFQISMLGYFSLKHIWLKLLIIWRFFRLWALFDDIETVENMERCMSNNFSTLDFWRTWHRSYNRWLIRYVYVPLGGTEYFVYNVWVVFTFVAIWHDIELRLLQWGWLVCLFILPEIIASKLFPAKTYWFYRHLCALGAVGNIIMMMTANLVGFAVGTQGIHVMLTNIFSVQGVYFIIPMVVTLFSAAQIMFELRERQKNNRSRK